MAAARLTPPRQPCRGVRIARVDGDEAWEAAVEVQASDATAGHRARYEALVRDVMRLNRRAVAAGHGSWWGAFDGDQMIATLGLFRVDDMARFQAVVTRPACRGRGIAATLLHHAAEAARADWDTALLLLEADADGPALDLYRRLGLAPLERRTSLTQDLQARS